MADRFTRGTVAGFWAGIAAVAVNQTSYYLEWSSLRFMDFAALIIFRGLPDTRGEAWFAFFVTLGFMGALGAVFALLVPIFRSGSMVLKGVFFGFSVWFVSYAVTALFRVPELQNMPLNNAVSTFISAAIWGLVLGFTFDRLNSKQAVGKQP